MKYSFFAPLLLVCLITFTSNSSAQERTITGLVTTLEKIPVGNAQVMVLSSKTTVLTDSDGKFEVKCLPKDKIKVSARLFKSKKVKINKETNEAVVDLIFTPKEDDVEQVVGMAIGYGYIREKDRSYAISQVRNTDKNNFMMYSNMIDVIVNSSTSVGYENGGFIIRGGSSLLGSNHALIIIDGREANITQLNALPVFDVESVDILKGGASTIYGSRGANGVIIVTTKK
jgi:TonB-dependent SusC/RagA subfamily outer membrane receptor